MFTLGMLGDDKRASLFGDHANKRSVNTARVRENSSTVHMAWRMLLAMATEPRGQMSCHMDRLE